MAQSPPSAAAGRPDPSLGGKERTFQYDDTLPSLPVPPLPATFKGLRDSLIPVATPEELAEYDAAVADAVTKLEDAQNVLQQRGDSQTNYIGPWWNEFAYLRNRFPNVLNTNVFCVRDADFDALGGPNPLTYDPVVRAALISRESMLWRRVIMKEQLPPEKMMGKHPMCMKQFSQYWTTRVPGIDCDTIYAADPRHLRRVAYMHRGAMFFVKTIVDDGKEDELSIAEMTAAIRYGMSQIRPPAADECVGTLTTGDRRKWAIAWQEIEGASARNKENLAALLDVITMVCIDDVPVMTLKEGINQASHELAHNRWYDRSSLRIVTSNGVSLEHGDHTAMDAIVMASTPVDLMAKWSIDFVRGGGLNDTSVREGFDPAKYVDMVTWDLTPSIKTMISEAAAAHKANCQGIEIDCFTYLGFGRDALRSHRVNADAFVQQALQLALYRDRNTVLPVYETASTRGFREGRTDTIRSLTPEQKEFVTTFDDPKTSTKTKMQRFAAALKKHGAVTMRASTGRGYDRHLLSLRIAQQHVLGRELPKLFELPLIARSGSYQLLTSQMIGRYFVGGFAHVLDDGYGCCYYLRRNAICVVVAGCRRAGKTDLDRYQRNLTKAFHDLAQLAMAGAMNDEVAPKKKKGTTAPTGSGEKKRAPAKL